MSEYITTNDVKINLQEEGAAIRRAFSAAYDAGRVHLDRAIDVGRRLLRVQPLLQGKFRHWLRDQGLNKTDCYDFMLLARNEESVRTSGHASIAAALRTLRPKSGRKSGKSDSSGSSLSKSVWNKATVEERRRFLDSVGANSLCEAFSLGLRAELRRRVAGQRADPTSALSEIIAKGIRQALSLQKAAKPEEGPAKGVAAALNVINTKLASADLDLNDVVVVIDPMAAKAAA
jgi:hypothetical protein